VIHGWGRILTLPSWRRFPNLPDRRFQNRRTIRSSKALPGSMACGFGNPRYSRLGSLRHFASGRWKPGQRMRSDGTIPPLITGGWGIVVGELFHGGLDALVIRQFTGGQILAVIHKNLGHRPAPVFDMAVGKRQVDRLMMASSARSFPTAEGRLWLGDRGCDDKGRLNAFFDTQQFLDRNSVNDC